MGAFSRKFSIAPSGENADRIKKVRMGANMAWTSSITVPSMVRNEDRGSAVDEKVWCFLFCLYGMFLSRFGITKFVIMEALWSSVIFKTIMVPLHRGRFVVVHLLYSSFYMDIQDFPLAANLYQKLSFSATFGAVKPAFLKLQRQNLASGCEPWTPSPVPRTKFCKNR